MVKLSFCQLLYHFLHLILETLFKVCTKILKLVLILYKYTVQLVDRVCWKCYVKAPYINSQGCCLSIRHPNQKVKLIGVLVFVEEGKPENLKSKERTNNKLGPYQMISNLGDLVWSKLSPVHYGITVLTVFTHTYIHFLLARPQTGLFRVRSTLH